MWMHSFLSELNLAQGRPATLYCDNTGVIALAKDARGHARVKYIDIRRHYIRERVEANEIEVLRVASTDNLADIFMKILPRDAHLAAVRTLGPTE
jgi:hypothetical protein